MSIHIQRITNPPIFGYVNIFDSRYSLTLYHAHTRTRAHAQSEREKERDGTSLSCAVTVVIVVTHHIRFQFFCTIE